jgi:hypothetical protein
MRTRESETQEGGVKPHLQRQSGGWVCGVLQMELPSSAPSVKRGSDRSRGTPPFFDFDPARFCRFEKHQLHWDGVFGVAAYVPTRTIAALGEDGTRAGYVFFRLLHVDLILDPVAFIGNSKQAHTVDARGWRAPHREQQKIAYIKQKKQN